MCRFDEQRNPRLKQTEKILREDDDDLDEVVIDDADDDVAEAPNDGKEMFMMEDEEAIVDEPSVGSLVLAKWSGDGFFYPGKITSVDLVSHTVGCI